MANDTDSDQHPPLPVDDTLNALDEVQAALDRLVAETRTAQQRVAGGHLALGEALSREEFLALQRRIPRMLRYSR
jgi:hypothetical protein